MGYLKRHGGERRSPRETAVVLTIAGFLSLFMLVGAIRSYGIARQAEREHDARLEEMKAKEARRVELEQKIQKFESGEGLEMEARSRLNLQRPDEHVLIILNDVEKSSTTTNGKGTSFWGWLKRLFSWQ